MYWLRLMCAAAIFDVRSSITPSFSQVAIIGVFTQYTSGPPPELNSVVSLGW